RIPQVTGPFRLKQQILINDNSTREGEQASEVSLGVEGKLQVLRGLAEIGIPQAQCGYPGKSNTDGEIVRRVRDEGIDIRLEGIASVMFDNWRDEIDATIDSGVDVLGIQYPVSDIRLRYVQRVDRAEALRHCVETVRYARSRAPIIKFSGTDGLRADLDFVKELVGAVLDAGADRICLPDTSGAAMPAAVRYFVGEFTDTFPTVPLQVHFHNDFGLALANTLTAVEAGAQIVDVSINGLGERAGNASLDEVVVALKLFYGIDLGIRTEGLKALSESFAELAGVPIYQYKPLVGDNAFAHKLDQHVKGILANPAVYEAMPPETVGNRRRIPIGKYTGRFALQYKLSEMGLSASDEEMERIKEQVEVAAIEKRGALTDSELASVVSSVRSARS
ncbi:MAG: LeuA family protein, partial [Chloroflexota bacterium]